MRTAGPTDRVTIHYAAETRDGGVVEDTFGRRPLTIALDDPRFLKSLREGLLGSQVGQTKTLSLEPDQVFGVRDNRMQLRVPLTALPGGIREGEQLTVQVDGAELDVWVVQLNTNEAVLDVNHPLAGEAMQYRVEILAIENAHDAVN
ncbi:peptidylprolyl isomerase [Rubinisphaera sp. JC750]|uniref:FKBP-type peptidyl-prolyl cis-trans isomerase n=1 Tax=Rubinisphaera sp. JC750 TaxID=2898658 RepID=UPI001F00FFCA|nr:FKBP-type peptidyl-prolyl cis-trans isomerase [Rubinisphaera sp. JC750]